VHLRREKGGEPRSFLFCLIEGVLIRGVQRRFLQGWESDGDGGGEMLNITCRWEFKEFAESPSSYVMLKKPEAARIDLRSDLYTAWLLSFQ
jgi:hypothetical protein